MSRTIKITNFDQAENLINRQANQINNLQGSINLVANNARIEAQKEITKKVDALRIENAQREQGVIKELKSHTRTKINELEIKHREALQHQSDHFYGVVKTQSTGFLNKLKDQARNFTNQLSDVNDTLRNDMRVQQQLLTNNINTVRKETIGLINSLTEDVNRNFSKQQEQIGQINQDVAHVRQDIKTIRDDLTTLFDKEKNDQQTAQNMFNTCQRVLNQASENKSVQKFESKELKKLTETFKTISGLQGNAQAVIASSALLINDIWSMEEEAQLKQMVFDVIYTTAITNSEAILDMMSRNREGTYFQDESGHAITDHQGNKIRVEIDYWTNNEYTEVEQKVSQIREELLTQKDEPTFEEEKIKDLLAELSELEFRQNDLVTTAACRGLLSEERLVMSENIVNAFLDRGYYLVEDGNGAVAHNYMGNEENEEHKISADPREGIYAILENGYGVNITVLVNPNEKLTSNSVIFQRNDENTDNPNELRETIDLIKDAVEAGGYKMGGVGSPQGTGDEKQIELIDAEALKNKGISKALKKRMGIK